MAGEAVLGAELEPLETISELSSTGVAAVVLGGSLGALRVMGGGRRFPAGAPPATGAWRTATGSGSGGGAGGSSGGAASWRALKLRFFRMGVAMGVERKEKEVSEDGGRTRKER